MGYAVELQDMQCRLAAGFPILAKRFYHIFKAVVVVAVGSWQLCQQNNSNGPANCCLIDSGAAINQLEVAANLATQLRNKESEATVLTCLLLLFLLLLWLYALVLSHVLFFSVFLFCYLLFSWQSAL